jgi:hypothetical protein
MPATLPSDVAVRGKSILAKAINPPSRGDQTAAELAIGNASLMPVYGSQSNSSSMDFLANVISKCSLKSFVMQER